jgi:hypothetical protein
LLLTAVLPAVAFFRAAWGLEIASLVKYGQYHVAQGLSKRDKHDEEILATKFSRPASERIRTIVKSVTDESDHEWGTYGAFFFDINSHTSTESGRRATSEEDTLPEVIEEILPFYSESSVRLRELVHDATADSSWKWTHDGAELFLHVPGDALQPVSSSRVPTFLESSVVRAVLPRFVALALGMIAIFGILAWVVRFMLYKIFVVDVMEPLWSGRSDLVRAVWAPNLFVVTDTMPKDGAALEKYCVIDLAEAPAEAADHAAWLKQQLERIQQAPPTYSVLAIHFEHRLSDRTLSKLKLTLLERILSGLTRTMVVISAAWPTEFSESSATHDPGHPAAEPEWTRRWSEVLARFAVVPGAVPIGQLVDLPTAGWREAIWRLNALGFALSTSFLNSERLDPQAERHWRDVLPYAWHPDRPPLNVSQLLVEVGERAETHYQEIWANCTPAEQLVIGQLAQEGIVNYKARRTVRALMGRGLVRREPHFVLMNETFRRFVLGAYTRSTAAALEREASSAWSTVRWPFFALVVLSVAFLFETQQQLFNTALAIVTGVTAFVPAVLKMMSLFGGRQTSE